MTPREKLVQFIASEFLDSSEPQAIPDDLDLVNSGIVDSLGILRIVAFLEDELNVVIEPEQMVPKNLSSVGAILNLVGPGSSAGQ